MCVDGSLMSKVYDWFNISVESLQFGGSRVVVLIEYVSKIKNGVFFTSSKMSWIVSFFGIEEGAVEHLCICNFVQRYSVE